MTTDEKTDWYPHPDYGLGPPRGGSGDLCTCGGIRYWHATKVGGGCEDCPCPEFEFA